jgi:nucleoside diphosphate kinase
MLVFTFQLTQLLLLILLSQAHSSSLAPALTISSVTSLPSTRSYYPPPPASTVPHLSYMHVCAEDDARQIQSISFNVTVSVSLPVSSLPQTSAAAALRVSWQFVQQEHVSGTQHACGLDGEGGCEVAQPDVDAALQAAAFAGHPAAILKCSFTVGECGQVAVAAWTRLQLCDVQRADVPSWAFSSPFPSDAAQQPQNGLTLAIIKPDAGQHTRAILREVAREGFQVLQRATLTLSHAAAAEFYAEHAARSFFPELLQFMTSAPCTVLLLQRANAVAAWRALIGPTDSAKARLSAPQSLRARYGTDGQQNAFHGSDSAASAAREISLFFPSYSPAHAAAAHATRWHEVEHVGQARAITLTAESEDVPFAFTVVPSRRMKLVGAEGEVLSAQQGGAVVGDFVIQHGVWAPASTRMFHRIIGGTCARAAGVCSCLALLLRCIHLDNRTLQPKVKCFRLSSTWARTWATSLCWRWRWAAA